MRARARVHAHFCRSSSPVHLPTRPPAPLRPTLLPLFLRLDGSLTRAPWRAVRMLTKTIDYLDAFSRFKKKENVEAVERLLSAHKEFHKFERAQLGTYSPARFVTTSSHVRPVG